MAELKTKPTAVSVAEFLGNVEPVRRRDDAMVLVDLYSRVTGQPAVMWGPSIIGYGRYSYRYASGHSGEAAAGGFSPRKASLTLYFADGFDHYRDQLARLGPHTTSVSCLYLKRLDAIDLGVLEEMVTISFGRMNGVHLST